MAIKQFNARINMKRDTASNWEQNNPVLLNGEIIIVDTASGEVRFKIGDGTKLYKQLPFSDEAVRALISAKQDEISLTENKAVISDASGKLSVSEVTSTELSYLDGVSSNLQTQIDNKVPTTRKINSKPLSSDITLTASDVNALPSSTTYVSTVDGSSGAITTNAVKYTSQSLTDAQKTQVRTNIGAGTSSFSGSYNDLTDKPTIPSDYVPTSRTVNGKALSSNVTLSASDVNASSKSTIVSATLSASSWSGDSAPYTYTLSVSGVTATSNQEFLPALNITDEQLTALQAANIQDGGQAANSVTLTAFGDKPTIDLPIRVIVRGDS